MRRATIVAAIAVAFAVPARPAFAEQRPPVLERFVARYNPSSTTTFYIAVAGDPDGGKVTYQWSLSAECGFLTEPEATGPSNGFQHGPPARRPNGCTSEQDRKANVTLRVVDPDGCSIVYTQLARDETEHVAPKVQSGPCPPPAAASDVPAAATGTGFPLVPLLLVAGVLLALYAASKLRLRTARTPAGTPADVWADGAETLLGVGHDDEPVFFERPPPEERSVAFRRGAARDEVLPTIRAMPEDEDVPSFLDVEPSDGATFAGNKSDDDDDAVSLAGLLESLDPATTETRASLRDSGPCEDGAVRSRGNDFVAHDTLLAGTVRARAIRSGNVVEIPPENAAEIVRLAIGMSDDAPLEVEVEVPVRLVTVMSSQRDVCRDGRWVREAESSTHDGPERIERLRAIVSSPEELERFAREILAKRLRSLTSARRRLESALAAMRAPT